MPVVILGAARGIRRRPMNTPARKTVSRFSAARQLPRPFGDSPRPAAAEPRLPVACLPPRNEAPGRKEPPMNDYSAGDDFAFDDNGASWRHITPDGEPPFQCHAPGLEWVPTTDIVEDPNLKAREETGPPTVLRYRDAMQAGAKFPPLTVARVGGVLCLVDGFHRLKAVRRLGARMVPVTMLQDGATSDDAFFAAVTANLTHGRGLSREERRAAFRRYLDTGRHLYRRTTRSGKPTGRMLVKSLREMAADFGGGFSHMTVKGYLAAMAPDILRRIGKPAGRRGDDQEAAAEDTARQDAARLVELVATKVGETVAAATQGLASLPPDIAQETRGRLGETLGGGLADLLSGAGVAPKMPSSPGHAICTPEDPFF